MKTIVRFAPSPTGNIHIGNLRTALINWIYARKMNSEFILRFDDTDKSCSKEKYINNIIEDLKWLGLSWNQVQRQSKRIIYYKKAIKQLYNNNNIYACYETSDELNFKRRCQIAKGLPPIYDRESLNLSKDKIKKFKLEGRKPHWRFKLQKKIVSWHDIIRGNQSINTSFLSDPVLIRKDGFCLYTLASVVDDIEMGITHIFRGEDHISNTGIQLEIFDALNANNPKFGHHNLLTNKKGKVLSKRLKSLSIRDLRKMDLEPLSIINLSATLGSSEPTKSYLKLDSIFKNFNLNKLSRTSVYFDLNELILINKKLLYKIKFEKIKSRLEKMNIKGNFAKNIWNAAKGNIQTISDIKIWVDIVNGNAKSVIVKKDINFIRQSLKLLPHGKYNEDSWDKWIKLIKITTGRKGKDLFMPLRLALTGLSYGIELKILLPMIGETHVRAYLKV